VLHTIYSTCFYSRRLRCKQVFKGWRGESAKFFPSLRNVSVFFSLFKRKTILLHPLSPRERPKYYSLSLNPVRRHRLSPEQESNRLFYINLQFPCTQLRPGENVFYNEGKKLKESEIEQFALLNRTSSTDALITSELHFACVFRGGWGARPEGLLGNMSRDREIAVSNGTYRQTPDQ
jgi:hypothetical protein